MGIDRTSEEDFGMSEKKFEMDIIIGLPDGKDRESNPSLTGHPIEEVKRTPPEEFQNVEGARLDLSGEFTALRSVKLGGALDGCGLSVGPERELESIRVVIGILKQREQELQAEYDKLMEAA